MLNLMVLVSAPCEKTQWRRTKESKLPILFEGNVSTLLVAKIHNKTPKFTVDHDMVDLLLRTFITSKCTVDHHIVDTIRCSLSVSRKPAFLAGPALE